MTHKYNIGDIIYDCVMMEHFLIVDICRDGLFNLPSYEFHSLTYSGSKRNGYNNIVPVDQNHNIKLVA